MPALLRSATPVRSFGAQLGSGQLLSVPPVPPELASPFVTHSRLAPLLADLVAADEARASSEAA
jgi:hypothetical protein